MFPEGRLFDFLIVGMVALIVVGPKDLPVLMRRAGQFMARLRGMAAEFRASFDELARQSELDELRREVQAMRTARPLDLAAKHIGVADALSGIRSELTETSAALAAASASHEAIAPQEPAPSEPAALPAPVAEAKPETAPEAPGS